MSVDHEEFRRRLESELAQVRETLAQAGVSAGTVTLDQSSVGRLSRMDALQQQAMAVESQERLRIRVRRIEAALDRVRAGSFGKCCQCGAEVEPARLQLDATTVFCGDCQQEREAPRGDDA
jgi:DnaK suppressor protein